MKNENHIQNFQKYTQMGRYANHNSQLLLFTYAFAISFGKSACFSSSVKSVFISIFLCCISLRVCIEMNFYANNMLHREKKSFGQSCSFVGVSRNKNDVFKMMIMRQHVHQLNRQLNLNVLLKCETHVSHYIP